jgi:hypothetical protein
MIRERTNEDASEDDPDKQRKRLKMNCFSESQIEIHYSDLETQILSLVIEQKGLMKVIYS